VAVVGKKVAVMARSSWSVGMPQKAVLQHFV